MGPRALASCGLWATLLFVTTLGVLGAIRPDYQHLLHGVNELGATGAPHAWAMNLLGFLLPGILVGFFGVALHRGLADVPGPMLGPLMISTSGLGWAGAGLFPLDFRALPHLGTQMHGLLILLCFVAAAVGMQLLARRLGGLFGALTRLAALLMLGNLFVVERPLLQRLFLAVYFLWLAGASLWLRRRLADSLPRSR